MKRRLHAAVILSHSTLLRVNSAKNPLDRIGSFASLRMTTLWAMIILALLVGSLASCAGSPSDEGENYGNLLDSPGGLILVEEEHPDGWRRSDCSMCHNFDNIHLVNRTGLDIDIAAIRQQAITNGDAGCPDCHGANGVE